MRKSITTALDRAAQRYFPRAYYQLIQKPRFRRRFANERQLARGVQLSSNLHPSLLFFTHPKCASRYVHKILVRLAEAEGMTPIDFDAYVTVAPPAPEFNPYALDGSMGQAFQPQGYYYGAMGSFRAIPQMGKYRAILHLRDPRDVLTSLYFSTAFSHAVISPKLIRRRAEAKDLTVDEFVLANADEVLTIYGQYCAELERGALKLLRYEEMVGDFEGWLADLARFTELDQHNDVLEAIKAEADFEVEREDKYSQRRQVTPGDYLRKLQPETIAALNERFAGVLVALNYSL